MNRDFALIDAGFNRAKEGIRTLDEIARFIVRDSTLYRTLRSLRHQLALLEEAYGGAELAAARDRRFDFVATHPQAALPLSPTLWSIIRSNAGRVAEALRTLESIIPVYLPRQAAIFQKIRYEFYFLEKELLASTPHYWLRRYFARGTVYPITASIEELRWFVTRGARMVQLRDKEADQRKLYQKTMAALKMLAEERKKTSDKIIFILNDAVDIATDLPVDGVHIGQEYPVAKARYRLGAYKLIGRSNNSVEQMNQSVREGADYLSLGPVFATPVKSERVPVGLPTVKRAADEITVPWVAIGGINPDNFASVYEAGCRSMAMIRGARDFFL